MTDAFTLTEQFGAELSENIVLLGQRLSEHFVLVSLSLILLCGTASALVYILHGRRNQFLYKKTTPLVFHRVMPVILVLIAVMQANHLNSTGARVMFGISLAMLLIALIGLWRFWRVGMIAEIGFLWLALPIKELPAVFAAKSDFSHIGVFSAPGQAGVYAAADYIVSRAVVLELIAAVLTALVAGYYSRRKYLFSRSTHLHFDRLTKCPACGIPLVFEGDFCPCCGQDIRHLPRSVMTRGAVIRDKFCRNCGKRLDDDYCSNCAAREEKIEHLSESVKGIFVDQGKAKIMGLVTAAVVMAVFFVPVLVSNPIGYLTRGSAQVNNDYVDLFNEVYDDSAVAKDAAWLESFDEATDALYQFDMRVFYLNVSRLDYNDLYTYVGYSEAAYYQMIVLEKTQTAVYDGDFESLETLSSYFNGTNSAMTDALAGSLTLTQNVKSNIFLSGENMAVDSLRFYLSFIRMDLMGIIFLAAAAGCGIATIIIRRKIRKDELFVRCEYTETSEDADAVERRRYVKGRWVEIVAGAATVTVLILCIIIEIAAKNNAPKDFSAAFTDLYITQNIALEMWIADAQNADTLSEKQIQEARDIVADMQDDIDVILDADKDSVDDIMMMWNIVADAGLLGDELDEFSRTLSAGKMPDTENIIDLMKQGMKYQQKILIDDAMDTMLGLYED